MSKSGENRRRLLGFASSQQGLFTSRQARAAGYSEKNHAYHVFSGSWIRLHRGIYRMADFPAREESQLALWTLWSADRLGRTQGVYSHETALSIYGLADLSPAKLHMTVPPLFRRNSAIPKVLILHRAGFSGKDVEAASGYRVTSPLRTILDLGQSDTVSREILAQGLEQGLRRGLITMFEARTQTLQPFLQDVMKRFVGEVKRGKSR